jgi:tRNA threonylcarbamoyl adenosine modification protein YeaZ
MKILAVEFSSARRSVAVVEDGRVLSESFDVGGRAAIDLVERALSQAKVEREQIECIAVGIGPGSYTGIRGAISLAQGWQLARDIKCRGISSIECMAAQAQRDKVFGHVAVIVDAQRQEFYVAEYEINATDVREVAAVRIVAPADVKAPAIIGPDKTPYFPQAKHVYPEAAMLGQMASMKSGFVAGEKLEAIYLRETNFVKVAASKL